MLIKSPFQNESEAAQLGGLTIENRLDRVELYGSLSLTRDEPGLAAAQALSNLLQSIVAQLQSERLPDNISIASTDQVRNPFADP